MRKKKHQARGQVPDGYVQHGQTTGQALRYLP